MKLAADGAQTDLSTLNMKLDLIRKDFKNAKPAPLPAGCRQNGRPENPEDYDSWLRWVVDVVLANYAECAVRHRKTVETWPK